MIEPGTRSQGSAVLQERCAESCRLAILGFPVLDRGMLASVLGWGLTPNPRELPSALLDRPVPEFALPPVKGRSLGQSSADLLGGVSLVNVFASWCIPCRGVHPLPVQLAAEGEVSIYGLNYRDGPDEAARWLDMLGNPYSRTGVDGNGRVGIDWGVHGMPETSLSPEMAALRSGMSGLLQAKFLTGPSARSSAG